MTELLAGTFAGNGIVDYLIFSGVVAASWAAGLLANGLIRRSLHRLAARTATHLDDLVVGVIGGPVILASLLVGLSVGAGYLGPGTGPRVTAERLAVALAYLAGAWALFRAVDGVARLYVVPLLAKSESRVDDVVVPLVIRAIKATVAVFSVLMALETFGLRVEPITNFLVQFALMLTATAAASTIWLLRSVVGGLQILFGKPFAEGDRIACGAHTGRVEKIELHRCVLFTDDGIRVAIPNHELTTTRVALIQVARRDAPVVALDSGRTGFAQG
jgi:MscS family membrane protein